MDDFINRVLKYQDNSLNRDYEIAVTEQSKKLTEEDLDEYLKLVDDKTQDMFARFSCFFVVYTYYRKNNLIRKLKNLVYSYEELFATQPLFPFIYIMAEAKAATISQLDALLSKGEKHLERYKNHIGFLNLYAELCATYYEVNLDMRGDIADQSGNDRLKTAFALTEKCCEEAPDYHKFYVNKGRISALLCDYDSAERFILEGISKVTNDSYHDKTVAYYEGFYHKIATVISYDKAQATIKLCEKKQEKLDETLRNLDKSMKGMQIDNFKNISIISTVIAFLLGGIEAFKNISDYHIISKVMLMYSGLFLCLIGFVSLIATVSTYKFKQKIGPNLLAISLVIVGIAIFGVMLIL